jgi:hypothetical protein
MLQKGIHAKCQLFQSDPILIPKGGNTSLIKIWAKAQPFTTFTPPA